MDAARATRTAGSRTTRRFFSSENVQYEGAEATLRKYLPKDEHIVTAVLGSYVGIYLLSKLLGGGDDAEEQPVTTLAAPAADSDDMVPSLFSDKFEDFINSPGGAERFEKACDEFDDWLKVPGNQEKYEAQFN